MIHFNLDFAGIAASAVKAWLDPFLRETLVSLLVWPNRIVVPLLPEQDTGPLDKLFLRCPQSCSRLALARAWEVWEQQPTCLTMR